MAAQIELRRDAGRLDATRGPWLREHQLGKLRGAPLPDEPVAVVDRHGDTLAWGLLSEASKIRVRVLSWGPAPLPSDWVERRLAAAQRDRDTWRPDATTGYRVVNAEGDGLPGLVVDRYAEAHVVQLTTAPMVALRERIVAALRATAGGSIHVVIPGHAARNENVSEVCDVEGGAEVLTFLEHGLRFEVAAPPAQKTGAYFDQRANRRWVAELAGRPGARVLDLGCHAGGFAVHAAAAGAAVVGVDVSKAALAMAEANAHRNGHDDITWVEADMFGPMQQSALRGPFSVIVADPPKVVANKRGLDAARSGMRGLVGNLVGRLAPGGVLLLCSCSHHFGYGPLDATVATVAGDRLARIGWRGSDADHPVMPGHEEGDYLRIGVYRRRDLDV
jgi:23S rRNA (cytosine1962-C5)-methyltransferase